MALNTQDQSQLYAGIKEHLGHKLVAVQYGLDAVNVAIECEDCNMVLLDADKPFDIMDARHNAIRYFFDTSHNSGGANAN